MGSSKTIFANCTSTFINRLKYEIKMLEKVMTLFSKIQNENNEELGRDELKIASTALLVHAASIDGSVASSEMEEIRNILSNKYDLQSHEIDELINLASQREKDAVDLYSFTSILTKHLDQEGRKNIISHLWEVVLADDKIDIYEENMVRRVADLLGVSTRDRVLLKQIVETKNNKT